MFSAKAAGSDAKFNEWQTACRPCAAARASLCERQRGARPQAFVPRLLARCSVEAYATGNLDARQAASLAARVEGLLARDTLDAKRLRSALCM
jgi:hypothetical protein